MRFEKISLSFLVSLYLHLPRLLPPPPRVAFRLRSPRRFYKVGQKEIKVKDSMIAKYLIFTNTNMNVNLI